MQKLRDEPAAPVIEKVAEKTSEKVEEKPAAPVVHKTTEAPALSHEEVLKYWPQVVEQAKPPSAKMSLKNGRVVGVEGSKVIVAFSSRFHSERVTQKEALHGIEDTLREIFKIPLSLSCILEQERVAAPVDSSEVSLADIAAEVF
jgi:hypothetical protein